MRLLTLLLLLPLAASAEISSQEFALNGVSLGATRSELLAHFPAFVKQEFQPPQFGAVEEHLYFQGAEAHVSDGRVVSIHATSANYKTPSGVYAGMSFEKAIELLGSNTRVVRNGKVTLRFLVRGSDCAIMFHGKDGASSEALELWCSQ